MSIDKKKTRRRRRGSNHPADGTTMQLAGHPVVKESIDSNPIITYTNAAAASVFSFFFSSLFCLYTLNGGPLFSLPLVPSRNVLCVVRSHSGHGLPSSLLFDLLHHLSSSSSNHPASGGLRLTDHSATIRSVPFPRSRGYVYKAAIFLP